MYLRHPWCAPPLAQTFPQLAQHVVERGALTHSHDSERSSLCSQRGSLSALSSLRSARSHDFALLASRTRAPLMGGRLRGRFDADMVAARDESASRRGHLSHADRGQGRVRALENAAHRCSPRVPSTDGARRTARSAICVLGSSAAAHEGGRDLREGCRHAQKGRWGASSRTAIPGTRKANGRKSPPRRCRASMRNS